MVEPVFFATPARLRAWLAKHHASEKELLVGLWKKDSGKPSITWPQLVEECLSFGWIDGIRRGGDDHYTIRITPRKPTSNWSAINIKLVEKLRAEGRMTPAGEAAFARRREDRSRIYSFEQETVGLGAARVKAFRAQKRAWAWWQKQPPGYRKLATWYVLSAKREETRERRFARVVESAGRGERITDAAPAKKAR